MTATKVDTLRVSGASLYYKVRGAGPVLLMIAGGAGDTESFNLVADHLVDHYTVVTYDRRGLSRSPLDDPDQPIEIETHSDDAHQENTRSAENREFVLRHDRGAVGCYRLDIAALQAAPTRIVLAGGEAGRDYFPYLCAARLAERLGTTVVEFPGHHAGYVSHPRAFAERLCDALGA